MYHRDEYHLSQPSGAGGRETSAEINYIKDKYINHIDITPIPRIHTTSSLLLSIIPILLPRV